MALPEVGNVFYPTPTEVLNQLLADLRYAYDRIGVTVNVKPNSDHWLRMNAIAKRISIAIANNQISSTAFSPLDAEGDDLERLANVFGVTRRGASQASGLVQVGVSGGGSVLIPAGFLATSAAGNEYETITAATVSDGDLVELISVNAGADQDVAFATPAPVLTWNSAAIGNLAQTATLDAGGIDGGNDEDDDETLRRRLLQRLSFPAVGGNPSQVSDFAEDATAAVERAFVYAAARGPGSYDVAVTRAGGDRALSTANLNTVAAAILAELPGHTDLNLTTVTAELVNVVIDIALPLPVNAGGSGGGFRDALPWPSDNEAAADTYGEITAVDVGANTITVNSTTADTPAAGRRFGIWDPNGGDEGEGAMNEYTILSVAGSSGAYVLTIDTSQSGSLAFVSPGMICSAGAERLIDYAEAVRAAIAVLGPGEKTDSPDILPRGRRRPEPGVQFPAKLTNVQLAPLIDEDDGFEEIQDVTYKARFLDGTGDAGTGTFTELQEPSVPPTTADPPKILVLNNLAFRAKVA